MKQFINPRTDPWAETVGEPSNGRGNIRNAENPTKVKQRSDDEVCIERYAEAFVELGFCGQAVAGSCDGVSVSNFGGRSISSIAGHLTKFGHPGRRWLRRYNRSVRSRISGPKNSCWGNQILHAQRGRLNRVRLPERC